MGAHTKDIHNSDLIGMQFNKLTIIGLAPSKIEINGARRVVVCKCECGNIKNIVLSYLKSGHTRSCGCLYKESRRYARSHGLSKHPLYNVWSGMKQRCYYRNAIQYHDYGGRGITICDEWINDFKAFYDWAITNGWREGLDIDREDNNGNYSPSNCRFVTRIVNSANKRDNRYLTYKGETKILSEWCRQFNISGNALVNRIDKLGMSVEEALETPTKIKYTYKGQSKILKDWAVELGLVYGTLVHRVKHGWSIEKAIETPPLSKHDKRK